MHQNDKLTELSDAGVSVWLDDLSRELIHSGRLAELVATRSVVGVTTNPAIFQASLTSGAAYDAQINELAALGTDVDSALRTVTTDDVRDACNVLTGVYELSGTVDGRVSLEVDPRLAHDADGTVAQAKELWRLVDRPNLLIKIPATTAGLSAITRVLAEGISVNVTLIFSVARYEEVIQAYLDGVEAAARAGHDISTIHSVASFFVSRVDSEVDSRLAEIGTPEAIALQGKAALANARLAYATYQDAFQHSDRFLTLAARGANAQRPLWASTGVKNPDYQDTLYVSELVAPGTVNTMPGTTMEAFADHGWTNTGSIIGHSTSSAQVVAAIAEAGVDLDDVFAKLEREGVAKFETAWNELLATTSEQLAQAPEQ